jgi:vitamin B12 transporter
MRQLACSFCLFGFTTSLAAQQTDTIRLKDLVVVATRFPAPVLTSGSSADLLRTEELQRRHIESLREALQLVGGGAVFLTGGPGGTASLFLRGASSTQTLFLLDGIRVNDGDASSATWLGGTDLGGQGTVEIARGPQSTLYGGAAIGGVVALAVRKGSGPLRGTGEIGGGSFGSWTGRAGIAGGLGRAGVVAAFAATRTDNERRPNDWDQRTQTVRLDYPVARRISLGATFRGIQSEYTDPGDLRTINTTPVSTARFRFHLGTLWLDLQPSRAWTSRLLAGVGGQATRFLSRFNGSPESEFLLEHRRQVIDWQNTVTLGGRVVLVGGINREWSRAISGADSLRQRLFGAYGQAQVSPVRSLHLTGGARLDDYNTFGNALTYRITAAWQLRPRVVLRGSAGSGFMPPPLAARFGGTFQAPNPEIRPERSRGWDLGVVGDLGKGSTVAATWFRNDLRDLLGFETAPFPEKGRSVNIDKARTSGVEIAGRLIAGPVDARLAYTLLSARSLSATDSSLARLIRRPRHTVNGDVVIAIGSSVAVGAGLLGIADREDDDFNAFPSVRVDPGDYLVARLHASWALGALILRGAVENLFNRGYEPVYGYPGLGRRVEVSVLLGY